MFTLAIQKILLTLQLKHRHLDYLSVFCWANEAVLTALPIESPKVPMSVSAVKVNAPKEVSKGKYLQNSPLEHDKPSLSISVAMTIS